MTDINALNKTLFPYAYNILGSIDDCQDVIQDVLIKFNVKDPQTIANQKAYLIKSVINQAINLKKKKQREREQKVVLPEPIVTNQGEKTIEINEILNYSMLVLIDALNTKERAVFLLKEAFDYDHDEIAKVLDISVENSRQLLTRGKKKLKLRKPNVSTSASKDRQYVEKYIEAIRIGDVNRLELMLSDEVQVLADAGTKLKAVAELTSGISATVKLMTYIFEYYQKDLQIRFEEINHQSALLFYRGSTLINCQIFELNPEGKISAIYSVVDPIKLTKI